MATNWSNETFFQLQIAGDNHELALTAENLDKLNDHVITKSKSKTVSDEVNDAIIKFKSVLDGFLQQQNILNPTDRNTIECKLSATNFVRKAFQIEGIDDGGRYPCIYSFAFNDKMRKITTISKLVKKGSDYHSQCFCQKSYMCDGEERSGDFKILLAFINYNARIDLYMSMQAFPVLSNVKNNPSSSSSSSTTNSTTTNTSTTTATEGKKKRKRKEAEIDETSSATNKVVVGSSSRKMIGSSSLEPSATAEQSLLPVVTVSSSAAENVTGEDPMMCLLVLQGIIEKLETENTDLKKKLEEAYENPNPTTTEDAQVQITELQGINEQLNTENTDLKKEIEELKKELEEAKKENSNPQVLQKSQYDFMNFGIPTNNGLDDIFSDENKTESDDADCPFMNMNFVDPDAFDQHAEKHQYI